MVNYSGVILGAIGLGVLWAMTTLGLFVSYRVLDVADLTVEGSIVLGASVAAVLIAGGAPPLVATFGAMLAGLLAGLVTAFFHTVMKIPPLLAGILSMIGLYSINIRVMGKANLSLHRKPVIFTPLINMGIKDNAAAIVVGLMCSGVIVVALFWFLNTEIGFGVRATGDSPEMARSQGINTNTSKVIGYAISNALVGLSGGLIAQYQGFADVEMGGGSIVIGLASLIIGEVLFAHRGGLLWSLVSMVLGSITYRVIIALVFAFGMKSTDLKLFTALTVAVALYLPYLRTRWGKKKIVGKEVVRNATVK